MSECTCPESIKSGRNKVRNPTGHLHPCPKYDEWYAAEMARNPNPESQGGDYDRDHEARLQSEWIKQLKERVTKLEQQVVFMNAEIVALQGKVG